MHALQWDKNYVNTKENNQKTVDNKGIKNMQVLVSF